jgi:methyltransferase family protein
LVLQGTRQAGHPLGGRRQTRLRALRRLRQLCPGPACVVETGTLRNDTWIGHQGDGWATLAWGWYCAQTGGRGYTIDIDPDALEVCRRATAGYAGALEYVHADSVEFLRRWDPGMWGQIHLLYLDSLDCDHGQQEESARHHLAEAEAALPALADPCLVLLDDTTPMGSGDGEDALHFTGKGERAVPFLLARGFEIEWATGGQVLLSRGVTVDEKAAI